MTPKFTDETIEQAQRAGETTDEWIKRIGFTPHWLQQPNETLEEYMERQNIVLRAPEQTMKLKQHYIKNKKGEVVLSMRGKRIRFPTKKEIKEYKQTLKFKCTQHIMHKETNKATEVLAVGIMELYDFYTLRSDEKVEM